MIESCDEPGVLYVMFLCPRCSGAFEWRIGVLPYPLRCTGCGFRNIPHSYPGLPLRDMREYGWPWIHRERARRALLAS